jgi:hypothetical protein
MDMENYKWSVNKTSIAFGTLEFYTAKYLGSIGLWRWYINITVTILDIIHRPVFYLKLNSTV